VSADEVRIIYNRDKFESMQKFSNNSNLYLCIKEKDKLTKRVVDLRLNRMHRSVSHDWGMKGDALPNDVANTADRTLVAPHYHAVIPYEMVTAMNPVRPWLQYLWLAVHVRLLMQYGR
jgi:hypothetical protein